MSQNQIHAERGASLFARLHGAIEHDEDDGPRKAWKLPAGSDADVWALFGALLKECEQRDDFRTAWAVPEELRPVVRRLMTACADMPAGCDDFAEWGRWHRAANILQGAVNRLAVAYFGETLGTEFKRLPLGDWSWSGLINAMR